MSTTTTFLLYMFIKKCQFETTTNFRPGVHKNTSYLLLILPVTEHAAAPTYVGRAYFLGFGACAMIEGRNKKRAKMKLELKFQNI